MSNFRPDTWRRRWSVVKVHSFSRAVGREGCCRQISGSGPWVACSSSFRVLHKSVDLVGPAFCAFPAGAAQVARSLTGALSPCAVRLIPSAVPASVSTQAGWVHLVSALGSWSLAATLPADVNHPESQEVFAKKLGTCLQFGRGCRLSPLSPPPCLLPPAGHGPVHCRLALLWNCSVFLLFLSNAARSSPFSPHLLVADAGVWGTFLLGVAFRHVMCGFYLFFLPVRLPLRDSKTSPRRATERVSWCLEISSIMAPCLRP